MTAPGGSCEADALEILHVDMDCFYAAVEVLDDPSLKGRPVIVGGIGPRGVVASCSYEARASGVRSAMPMAEARRRCPSAVFIAWRHGRYGEVSAELHEVFRSFTPVIEPIALDEAFLDVSGSHRLFGASEEIAWGIRRNVRETLGLDCSVGVARSKLIAKLASKEAKPRASATAPVPGRGVVVVRPEDEIRFLHPRPIRELWGVGPKTAERLGRYGVKTIAELAALDRDTLERLVGKAVGSHLHALSLARDERRVEPNAKLKSVGNEETFPTDRHDHANLHPEVVRLADSVGARLRAAGLAGRTVNLKLRFADFRTITRSQSLRSPLLSSLEIARIAGALLEAVDVGRGVRLLGVSVSSLEPVSTSGARQLSLLSADELSASGDAGRSEVARASEARVVARAEVEAAVDAIRVRYGRGALGPAVTFDGPAPRLDGPAPRRDSAAAGGRRNR